MIAFAPPRPDPRMRALALAALRAVAAAEGTIEELRAARTLPAEVWLARRSSILRPWAVRLRELDAALEAAGLPPDDLAVAMLQLDHGPKGGAG